MSPFNQFILGVLIVSLVVFGASLAAAFRIRARHRRFAEHLRRIRAESAWPPIVMRRDGGRPG